MKLKSTAALLGLLFAGFAHASPTFVNGLNIAGSTQDMSGDTGLGSRVGFFSDIYYDPNRNEWWGVSDRGPGGGVLNYETRVQRFTLDVNMNTGAISNFQVAESIKFKNGGVAMNGLAPSSGTLGNAFDPEGFAINPLNGRFLVSDEYGPSLYEFDRSGNQIRAFATPANITPRNGTTGTPNYASDTGNTAGKRTNRGFEGLAVSPDGQYTFAMLQSAMLDEGGSNGVYDRIVKFDNATGAAVAQYAYKMEGSSQGRGTSALVAINDHQFMVIERNNRGVGVDSDFASPTNKKVFTIDLAGATDVTNIDLDATGVVFTAVSKNTTPFIDLAANTLSALGNNSPEKWEGLAIGPRLSDGSFLLLAGTDNDYSVSQNGSGTQFDIYYNPTTNARMSCDLGTLSNCLAISSGGATTTTAITDTTGYALIPGVLHAYKASATDLAGYTTPVPEPETYAMLLAGLGLVGFMTRRRKQQEV